jgi:hypothetical protein
VEFLVSPVVGLEEEGLEEPGGMPQMPFRGADRIDRLHQMILHAERSAKVLTMLPYGSITLEQGGFGQSGRGAHKTFMLKYSFTKELLLCSASGSKAQLF